MTSPDTTLAAAVPVPRVSGNELRPPLKGVLLLMLAVLVFATMDTVVKYLAIRYNTPLVLAVRYVGSLVLVSAVLGPRLGMGLVRTRRTGAVLLRAGCLAVASLFPVSANRILPVAESTAVIYLAPLGVTVLAGALLGERVGLTGWLAAAAGLGGVILIARPGSHLPLLGVALALVAAVLTMVYQIMSRALASSETTAALLFYLSVAGCLLFGGMLPWFWQGARLDGLELALFAVSGALAALGHFLFTAAYRFAPASLLSPVNYLHLAWAGLLGWLVFDHIPDALTMLGLVTVAAAGVSVALKSRR